MEGKRLEYRGEEALKELEKFTAKADEVQENILKEIIARNCETEYLKKYMGGSKGVLEFKQRVPVSTYKDIHPYVQRIANGEDSSLLSGHPITEMLCRSLDFSLHIISPSPELVSSLIFLMNLRFLHPNCSSGTSGGEPKLMPSIAEDLNRRTFLYNLIMPIMNQLHSSLYASHLLTAF